MRAVRRVIAVRRAAARFSLPGRGRCQRWAAGLTVTPAATGPEAEGASLSRGRRSRPMPPEAAYLILYRLIRQCWRLNG